MTIINSEVRAAAPTRWSVDRDETSVEFAVKTFWGLTTVHGRFDRFGGSYETGPGGTKIELTIDADSLDTGNATRDKHLRSTDFFHVTEHPQVRFTSTRVRYAGDGVLRVEGDLEAAGKVAPLEIDATVRQVDDGLQIEAMTTVDPRQLGMSSGQLGMIRPPATLHVKARLNGTTKGETHGRGARAAGDPDEVAKLAAFLASGDSSFSTGADFVVNGRETAGEANGGSLSALLGPDGVPSKVA